MTASIPPSQEGCSLGGVHRIKHWTAKARQGVVCVRCHKTWTATPEEFEPTWKEQESR